VDAVKPLFWLGEFDELENPDYGYVFDASYSWKWMHKTKDFYQNHLPLSELDSLLSDYSDLKGTAMRAWFTTNHDENSWNGTEYEKYGNMAKALAVFSCTWDGVPLIYNGQEIPMLTKRLAFFEKDPIPWTGTYEMADFYKTLLTLKANNPALRGNDSAAVTARIRTSADHNIFAFLRKNGNREVLVLINMSYTPDVVFEIADDKVTGTFKEVFTGETKDFGSQRKLELKAWEYRVFEK
jgi:alpha-amylase